MIPEWLSFQNEFIPSPYISLYLFTWYRNEILFPHNSFWNDFIPVFNPNEILVLVWHVILVSCKLKMNFVPRWKRKSCSLGRVAYAYCFQDGRQNGRFQDGWAGRFCHVNAVRTSFWNETHSGIKLILVSCEQPLRDPSQKYRIHGMFQGLAVVGATSSSLIMHLLILALQWRPLLPSIPHALGK